jgi:hypothetical protein
MKKYANTSSIVHAVCNAVLLMSALCAGHATAAPFRFLFEETVDEQGNALEDMTPIAELTLEQIDTDVVFELSTPAGSTDFPIDSLALSFSPYVEAVPEPSQFSALTSPFGDPALTVFPGLSFAGYDFNLSISFGEPLVDGNRARWKLSNLLVDDLLYGGVTTGSAPAAYFLLKASASSGTSSYAIATDFASPASPVPEASSWALALAGLVTSGLILKRRHH